MNKASGNKARFRRLFDRLVICIFTFVWRSRLIEDGEKLTVVFVRGWRTAAVKGRMRTQETRTFLLKVFGKYI